VRNLITAVMLVAGLTAASIGNSIEIPDNQLPAEKPRAAAQSASTNPITRQGDVLKPLKPKYPKGCDEQYLGRSGLCLLTNKRPLAQNSFLVSPIDRYGVIIGKPIWVPYNKFLSLSPGRYALYSSSGIDEGHELRFDVVQGQATTLMSSTVKFGPSKKTRRLQHYQSVNGTKGKGCVPELFRSGVRALLPGNYQVEVLESESEQLILGCAKGGVTFNALAGKTLSATLANMSPQNIPQSNQYKHPDGVSALSTLSSFRENVLALAILPNWRLVNDIPNPLSKSYNALILSGLGATHYVIPFTVRNHKRECGISLAEGGLHSHVLLTGCKFKGNKLTEFKVQPGSFYTLNNRHGKTAIEGNFINSPIAVSNVRFSLN
jgi:hypothetical protein